MGNRSIDSADVDGIGMGINGMNVDRMYIDGIGELWLFTADIIRGRSRLLKRGALPDWSSLLL